MTLRAIVFVGLLFTFASLAGVVVGARTAAGDADSPRPATAAGDADSSRPATAAADADSPRTPTATPEAVAPLELVDVTSSPSTPGAGERYEVSVTVRNTAARALVFLLDVESYVEVAPDDWTKDPQRVKDGVSLDGGATRTYTFDMESAEAGPHVVKVGAFSPGWWEVIVFWDEALLMTVNPAE